MTTSPADVPAARRRLDPDARRRALLETAAVAFGAAPYAQVSVAAVAAAAGVSEALVFRYFATKAELYTAVVAGALDLLTADQAAADAALPVGVPTRDRVRTSIEVLLDHVARHRSGWAAPHVAGPDDPAEALTLRRDARRGQIAQLRAMLRADGWARHEYAVSGHLGFLDGAALEWVERGCPPDERWAVVDSALGSLEGALGDWRS